MEFIGLVKWWNMAKGFGFITSLQGHDLFAHYSEILAAAQDLQEGQEVSYKLKTTDKGLVAISIKPL